MICLLLEGLAYHSPDKLQALNTYFLHAFQMKEIQNATSSKIDTKYTYYTNEHTRDPCVNVVCDNDNGKTGR